MPNTHLGDSRETGEASSTPRRIGRISSWGFRLILLVVVVWLGRTFQSSDSVERGFTPESDAASARPRGRDTTGGDSPHAPTSVPGCPNVMTLDDIRYSLKLFNVRKARIRCILDKDPPVYPDQPTGFGDQLPRLQKRSSSLSNWQRTLYTHLGEGDLSKGMAKYDIPMPDAERMDERLVAEISKQRCPFAESPDGPVSPPHKPADGPFAVEGYALVEFLYKEMFLKHGWIPVPVAGTALGALRHFGMYEGDDDMDIVLYPPTRYLLQQERENDAHRNTTTTTDGSSIAPGWTAVYEDFDRYLREYAQKNPHFQWERKGRLYDAPVGEHNTKEMNDLHRNCPFSDYHRCVSMTKRSCGAYYETRNRTELRRMFFPGKPCMPNHWFLCIQPTPFLLERSVGSPSLFASNATRPTEGLCMCPFGPPSNSAGFLVCPTNLIKYITLWYGRTWCIPTGPVQDMLVSKWKSWKD